MNEVLNQLRGKLHFTQFVEIEPGVWRGWNKNSPFIIQITMVYPTVILAIAEREFDLAYVGKLFVVPKVSNIADFFREMDWTIEEKCFLTF